jgi:hypothetical protein
MIFEHIEDPVFFIDPVFIKARDVVFDQNTLFIITVELMDAPGIACITINISVIHAPPEIFQDLYRFFENHIDRKKSIAERELKERGYDLMYHVLYSIYLHHKFMEQVNLIVSQSFRFQLPVLKAAFSTRSTSLWSV